MDDSPSVSMRQCNGPCQRLLPETPEFFYQSKGKFLAQCKQCKKAKSREYGRANAKEIYARRKPYRDMHREELTAWKKQYYASHREEILAQNKVYRQSHLEQIRERDRKRNLLRAEWKRTYLKYYYERNKMRLLADMKVRYENHRDQKLAYQRLYRERHSEQIRQWRQSIWGRLADRAYKHKRAARKKASGGSYTAAQLQDQIKRQRGHCYYCRAVLQPGWHADHIVPLSKGGSSNIDNIVITCPTCNLKKKDRLLHEWPEGGRLL